MNYHDLLGVSPDAGPQEIRDAWQAKVADVDPSDWRFAAYNEALTELLKQHAEQQPEQQPEEQAEQQPEQRPGPVAAEEDPESEPNEFSFGGAEAPPSGAAPNEYSFGSDSGSSSATIPQVPLWLLGALAVLAAVCVAVAAIAWTTPSARGIEDRARGAQTAAESAVTAILSYDYRTLDQSARTAESTMTSTYRTKKYAPYFKVVQQNAPGLQAVVTSTVVDSSIVRAGEDRVQVLVLFDQSSTNKSHSTPLTDQDHATLTMERVGDDWLVSDITT